MKFTPHPEYKFLLRQAKALNLLVENKQSRIDWLQKKVYTLEKYVAANKNEDLRDTIETLTNLLED